MFRQSYFRAKYFDNGIFGGTGVTPDDDQTIWIHRHRRRR